MSSGQLRIAGVQLATAWNDISTNLNETHHWVRRAADMGADLVVLSELFATGFIPEGAEAQTMDGQVLAWMQEEAKAHNVVIAGSVLVQRDDRERPTNTAAFVGPDGVLGLYDKARPFSISGEDQIVQAGQAPLTVTINGVRVTPFICYDLRFPGLFWQTGMDTDVFVVLANWPSARSEHWNALLKARAIENQAYVVGVNRIGADGNHTRHSGLSAAYDPRGEQMMMIGEQAGILLADIDANRVERLRDQFPVRKDR